MRYVRIFFLFFQNVFQYKSQIFIWFLISLLHPLIYLLLWSGASGLTEVTNFSNIVLYYLFFIIAGGLLFVHVEVDAYEDIQQGNLSAFLMKPFSYLKIKFFSETPWRLIQGGFGFISLSLLIFINPALLNISLSFDQIITALLITFLGYMVMFLFKMNILLSALWFIDFSGFQQFIEIVVILLAGFVVPIYLLPTWIANYIYITPFPYTIYFPVIAFTGMLKSFEATQIMGIQIFWIIVLYLLYRFLWKHGIKKFSAVGQ